jgi:hypothetical protein
VVAGIVLLAKMVGDCDFIKYLVLKEGYYTKETTWVN